MLDMFPKANIRGFTIIELLVVLVILGMLAAAVTPALDNWLMSREAALAEEELSTKLAALPLQASRAGRLIVIQNEQDLQIDSLTLSAKTPIKVLPNGFCSGGELTVDLGDRQAAFTVHPPFCELTRAETN